MPGMLKSVIATIGAAALSQLSAAPALAQQGGAQPGGPPPGAQGAPGAGAPQGGPPRARPAPPPPNTGIPLSAALSGARGTGYAGVVIDPPAGTVCYLVNATLADPPTMAHIHGPDGKPVVAFTNPADGASGGCMPIAAPVASAILANPGSYYVNVHTTVEPQGAIRGTLTR